MKYIIVFMVIISLIGCGRKIYTYESPEGARIEVDVTRVLTDAELKGLYVESDADGLLLELNSSDERVRTEGLLKMFALGMIAESDMTPQEKSEAIAELLK